MSDGKPLASLSSSLLARKGQAAPAMRRQALDIDDHASHSLEDLGWNDMGHDFDSQPVAFPGVEAIQETPAPVVHEQHEALSREFEPERLSHNYGDLSPLPTQAAAPVSRAAPGSKGKSAFTLRLDGDRHLQLRLVCAMKHRSAQQIVTEALDAFLSLQPEVADLQRNKR